MGDCTIHSGEAQEKEKPKTMKAKSKPKAKPKGRPVFKIVSASYQPSKAELEEEMALEGATVARVAQALMRTVKVRTLRKPARS